MGMGWRWGLQVRGGGLQVQGLEWSSDTWDCSYRVCTESEPVCGKGNKDGLLRGNCIVTGR